MISGLQIREIKDKGRGVFCSEPVKEGRIIEICPLLIFPVAHFDSLHPMDIEHYWFAYNRQKNLMAVALGYGSLYNHACPANAQHDLDYDKSSMIITALEYIPANTEICINYNGAYNDASLNWFVQRNLHYVPR